MARRKTFSSQLYRGARDLGNLEAGTKGPTSYGQAAGPAERSTNRITAGLPLRLAL